MNENNYDEMENFLSKPKEKKVFVFYKNDIKLEELDRLVSMYIKNRKGIDCFKKCFETTNECGKNLPTFSIELLCHNCFNVTHKKISKTKLFEYFAYCRAKDIGKKYKNYLDVKEVILCDDCLNKEKEKKQKDNEELAKTRAENKKFYIDNYLNENCVWKLDYKKNVWPAKGSLEYYLSLFTNEELREIVDNMEYYDYLKTPYWKFVSYYKKRQSNFKCQLCNSTYNLNTHHRTYEHKGKELDYLNDLIVLCEDCHNKFHEIGE